MNLKDRLADKVRKYHKAGYRSDEGANIFDQIIKVANEAAERGTSTIRWPKKPFIKPKNDHGRAEENLPDLYLEVKSRLEEEKLKVGVGWVEETDYGSGPYGENQHYSGLEFVISWQD